MNTRNSTLWLRILRVIAITLANVTFSADGALNPPRVKIRGVIDGQQVFVGQTLTVWVDVQKGDVPVNSVVYSRPNYGGSWQQSSTPPYKIEFQVNIFFGVLELSAAAYSTNLGNPRARYRTTPCRPFRSAGILSSAVFGNIHRRRFGDIFCYVFQQRSAPLTMALQRPTFGGPDQ